MNLVLVGMNHRTAPLELRELYTVPARDCVGVDEKLRQLSGLDEVCLISTCNRIELLGVSRTPDAAVERLQRFLADEIGGAPPPPPHLYELRDGSLVRHFFRVAASLDSMVLGETQILGQLKDAYRAAVQARACGPVLHRLFHRAFRTAKRVRSETGIGAAPVSIARVAIQLAGQLFESFAGKRVLLVGAGEMAEAALHALREAGAPSLAVINRTREPAHKLAERLGGRAAGLEELEVELARADLAILSLAVERPLVSAGSLRELARRRHGQPLLLIDLGLPRNAAPDAAEVENVFLYDLDDLESVAASGRARRREAVESAEVIVVAEAERFERWLQTLPLAPAIRELLARGRRLVLAELERELADTGRRPEELERLADALVSKLFHAPLEELRRSVEEGGEPYYGEALRRLFRLDESETDDDEEGR